MYTEINSIGVGLPAERVALQFQACVRAGSPEYEWAYRSESACGSGFSGQLIAR